ncbi:MAG: hypothetical protein ACLQAT_06130, partial [Candidatus Binataceae bacterium]
GGKLLLKITNLDNRSLPSESNSGSTPTSRQTTTDWGKTSQFCRADFWGIELEPLILVNLTQRRLHRENSHREGIVAVAFVE